MCRILQAGLKRHPSSPARARQLVIDTLHTWDMQRHTDLQDTAVLLADELVTNTVLHARTPARLVMAAANGTLELGVTDLSARMPRRRQVPPTADELSTHGRGLELLEVLADEWGVVPLSVGKQTWFRLHTPARNGRQSPPEATACLPAISALHFIARRSTTLKPARAPAYCHGGWPCPGPARGANETDPSRARRRGHRRVSGLPQVIHDAVVDVQGPASRCVSLAGYHRYNMNRGAQRCATTAGVATSNPWLCCPPSTIRSCT